MMTQIFPRLFIRNPQPVRARRNEMRGLFTGLLCAALFLCAAIHSQAIAAVNNPTVSGIDTTSATLGANVTGTSGNTERGTVWNTSPSPTTANNKLASGSGQGTFTHLRTGWRSGPPRTLFAGAGQVLPLSVERKTPPPSPIAAKKATEENPSPLMRSAHRNY